MSRRSKIILVIITVLFITVLIWLGKKNKENIVTYDTEKPFKATIEKKAVATGRVIPLEEVDIKPQISGIIEKVYLEEGVIVKSGDLIATVRVVPNVQSLNSANGIVKNAQLTYENAKIQYDRNKKLFDKGVISGQDYENSLLSFNNAKQGLNNAKSDLDIIKRGTTAGLGRTANTNIRATTSGMIVEIPVKKGYQVIQSNNFNEGTTIATIADMTKMIFEGNVDESEVSKLVKNSNIEVSIGAIEGKKFPAKLNFIAPKGTEENGAVQFKIKADVSLDDTHFVRAGYSANANIILEKKDSVLSIKESLLRFDKDTEKPYVEIKTNEKGDFEKKVLELGVSDGVNVEVLEGLKENDEVKVWNKASKEK